MAQNQETRTLRIAFHVFNDSVGSGNFQADSLNHQEFLHSLVSWINHKMNHLDTLKPSVSSPFVPSLHLQLHLDTIYFHRDTYAWDCSDSLDSEYMRTQYVDLNKCLSYQEKYQTLPIFFGDNYRIVGGHVSAIGSKRLIAMRGVYSMYTRNGRDRTLFECGRNIFHELGHALGLNHNFQGGPAGDQCDECDDNGCPEEGTSNNLMDYWPSYGGGISVCQLDIINRHLRGEEGSIGEVILNDSCSCDNSPEPLLINQFASFNGPRYLNHSLIVEPNGVLEMTGEISMAEGQFIRVMPGGQLILRHAQLTNACGDLWGGIERLGDSRSHHEFQKLLISNALTGMKVRGGVFLAIRNCQFENCPVAIDIEDNTSGEVIIEQCTFRSQPRYPHYEEGVGPVSFIKSFDASVELSQCTFVNTDQFRSVPVLEAGVGIQFGDGNLTLNENGFYWLTTAVELTEVESEVVASLTRNNFFFCAKGIQARSVTYLSVLDNQFDLNRFNELSAIGLHASAPGWMDVRRNSFASRFGGEDLVGLYVSGQRAGTQLISENSLTNLGYGIFEDYSQQTTDWLKAVPDYTRGLGLVLDRNIYEQVAHKFLVTTGEGYGLSSMGINLPRNSAHFQIALRWPLGGLSHFTNGGDVGLVLSGQSAPRSNYPQHNFFINRYSDENQLDTLVNYEYRVYPPNSPGLAPGFPFTSQYYLEQIEPISQDPVILRDSEWLESIGPFDSWPHWALMDLIKRAQGAGWNDHAMSQIVRKLAFEQLSMALISPEFRGQLTPVIDSVFLSTHSKIRFPQVFFKPGIPTYPAETGSGFILNPNPASDQLAILPVGSGFFDWKSPLKYTIMDLKGSVIQTGTIQEVSHLVIRVNHLAGGMYLLKIEQDDRFLGQQKFIIFRPN